MMPGIEKAPTLAITGRRTGAGAKKEAEEKTTRSFTGWEGLAAVKRGGLTHALAWGMVEAPNCDSRNRRLSLAPQGEKDLSAYSAITHTLAGTVSGGRCAYIGRAQRPGRREAPAATQEPGSVGALPLSF